MVFSAKDDKLGSPGYLYWYFFLMPTSDNPNVVVEVRRSLLSPVRHCPHHGPGPLLPPLCPHSYTAQLPPLDPPEATTSVVRLNQLKPSMQWRGYKPTTLSSEGICAYAQPLLVERLNLSSRLIHAVMGTRSEETCSTPDGSSSY